MITIIMLIDQQSFNYMYLVQRLSSVAVKQGNIASVPGNIKMPDCDIDHVYFSVYAVYPLLILLHNELCLSFFYTRYNKHSV